MSLHKLLIFFVLALPFLAFAGREGAGGGGGTVFYAKPVAKPILLDFAAINPDMAIQKRKRSAFQLTRLDYKEGDGLRHDDPKLKPLFGILKEKLKKLLKTQPFFASQMALAMEGLGLRYTENEITNVDDYFIPTDLKTRYPEFKFRHIVRYTEESGAFLNAKLFDELDFESQIGVIIHELYRVFKMRMYAIQDEAIIHNMTYRFIYLNEQSPFDFEDPSLYVANFKNDIVNYRQQFHLTQLYALKSRMCSVLSDISTMNQSEETFNLNKLLDHYGFFANIEIFVSRKMDRSLGFPVTADEPIINHSFSGLNPADTTKAYKHFCESFYDNLHYVVHPRVVTILESLRAKDDFDETQIPKIFLNFGTYLLFKKNIHQLAKAIRSLRKKGFAEDETDVHYLRVEELSALLNRIIDMAQGYESMFARSPLNIFLVRDVKESSYLIYELLTEHKISKALEKKIASNCDDTCLFNLRLSVLKGLEGLYGIAISREMALAREELTAVQYGQYSSMYFKQLPFLAEPWEKILSTFFSPESFNKKLEDIQLGYDSVYPLQSDAGMISSILFENKCTGTERDLINEFVLKNASSNYRALKLFLKQARESIKGINVKFENWDGGTLMPPKKYKQLVEKCLNMQVSD